ncbi:MAG: hypothetical protein ACYCPO_14980, partial [Acidobacteriaceae bacterium]
NIETVECFRGLINFHCIEPQRRPNSCSSSILCQRRSYVEPDKTSFTPRAVAMAMLAALSHAALLHELQTMRLEIRHYAGISD